MPKIIHQQFGDPDNAKLIEQIDAAGGWLLTAKSLVMRHGTERDCYFSGEKSVYNEWNTSVLTSDEYYWHKVSVSFKEAKLVEHTRNYVRRMVP